jgi:hypothetical protein
MAQPEYSLRTVKDNVFVKLLVIHKPGAGLLVSRSLLLMLFTRRSHQ